MPRVRRTAAVADLVAAMQRIAPPHLAADWDNVGLLAGSPAWPARRVLVAVDLTPAVLDEAARLRCDAILSYHPPIFRPIKAVVPGRRSPTGLAAEALSRRIAVYSPHTAWDAAPGGANDTLARLCGLTDCRPFAGAPRLTAEECKIVVFVPADHVEAVAAGLFAAGAGRIGDYTHCSFRIPGEGTFFGTEATDPAVGRRGRLERVREIRLEAVSLRSRIAEVVAAIRRTHPYEEPAFDVYPLVAAPAGDLGQGRIGRLPRARSVAALARLLQRRTGARNVTLVGRGRGRVRRVLVCVGAAGSLPIEIPGEPCSAGDVVVTGEIRHHDARRYLLCGAAAIALGHWASERPGVQALAARLRKQCPSLRVEVSRADADPFAPI